MLLHRPAVDVVEVVDAETDGLGGRGGDTGEERASEDGEAMIAIFSFSGRLGGAIHVIARPVEEHELAELVPF